MTELFKRTLSYTPPFKEEDNPESQYPQIKDLVYNLYTLSYWDGPLSGIGYWNGKVCFFKSFVEEYIVPIDDENEEAYNAADEARDNGFWRRFFIYDVPPREAGYLKLAFHVYSLFIDGGGDFPSVQKYEERTRTSRQTNQGFYRPGLTNCFKLFPPTLHNSSFSDNKWFEIRKAFASNANRILEQFTKRYGKVNLEDPKYIAGWIDNDQLDYL